MPENSGSLARLSVSVNMFSGEPSTITCVKLLVSSTVPVKVRALVCIVSTYEVGVKPIVVVVIPVPVFTTPHV